jgi:hypothetical protein
MCLYIPTFSLTHTGTAHDATIVFTDIGKTGSQNLNVPVSRESFFCVPLCVCVCVCR